MKKQIEYEKTLMGSLIRNPKNIIQASLRSDDFISKECRDIFISITKLMRSGFEADIPAISKESGVDIGELSNLTDWVPCGVKSTSRIIAENGRKRRLLIGIEDIKKDSGLMDSGEFLSDLLRLYRSEEIGSDKDYSPGGAIKELNKVQEDNLGRGSFGVPTGFKFLDNALIHYCPGQMWVVSGYLGTGKTNTLIQMIRNIRDKKVVVYSTEMMRYLLVARYLANETAVDSKVILSGNMRDIHRDRVDAAKKGFAEGSIKIIDDLRYIEDIERHAMVEALSGVDVIFIDYLQHLKIRGSKGYEAFSEISHIIQEIGKKCNCCTVNFSQVTFDSAATYDGTARTKGANDFAEDADVSIRLIRKKDEKYNMFWVTDKNRHGPEPRQVLEYRDGFTRFEEIEHDKNSAG